VDAKREKKKREESPHFLHFEPGCPLKGKGGKKKITDEEPWEKKRTKRKKIEWLFGRGRRGKGEEENTMALTLPSFFSTGGGSCRQAAKGGRGKKRPCVFDPPFISL